MRRCLMPRLRALSSVRSSSTVPTPLLCHSCSMLKAASASSESMEPLRRNSGGAAQHAVDKEAVHHDAKAGRCGCVLGDEFVGNRTGKAGVAAVAVEPQQVVAIGVGLADPQFADGAAAGRASLIIGIPLVSLRLPDSVCVSVTVIWCSNAARLRPLLRLAGLSVAKNGTASAMVASRSGRKCCTLCCGHVAA